MAYQLFIVDDDLEKLECFKLILNKINEDEGIDYINGFGDQIAEAPTNAALLIEKLDHSTEYGSYWLIDLEFAAQPKEHRRVAEELERYYFAQHPAKLQKLIADFSDRLRFDPDYYLALVLIAILKDRGIPFCIISRVYMDLPETENLKENYTFIVYPLNTANDSLIKKAAANIIQDIKNRNPHPVTEFLKGLNGHNCHSEPGKGLPCMEALAKFLHYNNKEEFYSDFRLFEDPDRPETYRINNIFEECLKTFSGKGKSGLSLLGVALICWSAYRQLAKDRKDQSKKAFAKSIKHFNDIFMKNKCTVEELEAIHGLARTSSVIAPSQDSQIYEETLRALYDMIQPLYTDEKSGADNLEFVKLEEDCFTIYLAIKDRGNLIRTLNLTHQRLIDAIQTGQFSTEHTTSMRILRFWMLTKLATYEREDFDGTKRVGNSHDYWGGFSAFTIDRRKDKGITIKFSL